MDGRFPIIAATDSEKWTLRQDRGTSACAVSGESVRTVWSGPRHFGANITGVCSTANLELVESLGAGTVIDYTREDFLTRGDLYDLIFDAVPAVHRTVRLRGTGGLTPTGKYISCLIY